MEKYREDLLAKNKEGSPLADAGPVTFGTRLNCSHFPAGYEAISYGRGTWLFHMLRYMMRDAERKRRGLSANVSDAQADAPFFRALSKVRERFQEKSINTREMLQVFEEELPPSLGYEGQAIAGLVLSGMGKRHRRSAPRIAVGEIQRETRRFGRDWHNCAG